LLLLVLHRLLLLLAHAFPFSEGCPNQGFGGAGYFERSSGRCVRNEYGESIPIAGRDQKRTEVGKKNGRRWDCQLRFGGKNMISTYLFAAAKTKLISLIYH